MFFAYALQNLQTIVLLLLAYSLYAWRYRETQGRLPLPPSPRGWPFIGHILQLGSSYQWKTYHRWCKELGTGIMYINLLGKDVIVLDKYEDCIELLEKRSQIYSGRMESIMVNELMGWEFNFTWKNYGNLWRDRRRIMHDAFNPGAVKSFRPMQLQAARKLLQNLLHTNDILPQIRRLAGETIIGIAYGLDVEPENDPYVEAAEQGVSALLEAAIPGAFFVDMLPVLKYVPEWIPGAGFKRKAREWRAITEKMVNGPFEALLEEIKEGTARPSFSYDALQTVTADSGIYTEENIKFVAGTMYQTGSDTTLSGIGFCILSLLGHPEIVKKIQEEIDGVTDSIRLPDFGDEDSLPYLMACIKESMRYWSFVPLSVPHLLTADDEYKGYRMPAGSIIVPNSWAILHDEEVFPEPFTFNPDRFLDGDNLEVIHSHFDTAWGFGRRTCVGRYMAFGTMWITLAHIFAVYNLSKTRDEAGNIIEPSQDLKSAILLSPPPYRCVFKVRSKAAQELLVAAAESE